MPTIHSVQSLTFNSAENSAGIQNSRHLLGDSFEYTADDHIAQFYAVLSPATSPSQKLWIKLLDAGNNIIATHNETVSSNRISFLVDIDDLNVGSFTAQVSFANFDEVGSGGIVIGGTATVSRTTAISGSGGIIIGGTPTVSNTKYNTGSGGLIGGGTATVSRVCSNTGTGGIVIGGTAINTFIPGGATYSDTGTGGLVIAGTVLNTTETTKVGTGGIVIGGTLVINSANYNITGEGGIVITSNTKNKQLRNGLPVTGDEIPLDECISEGQFPCLADYVSSSNCTSQVLLRGGIVPAVTVCNDRETVIELQKEE